MLTEGLSSTQKVDGSQKKIFWGYKNLMESDRRSSAARNVDGRSSGHTKS